MSTNKEKMNKMMTLRNFSPKTKEAYIGAVQRIANYHKKGPEKLTTEEVQDYILNMREQKGLSWSTCNVAISGLHFFFTHVLEKEPGSIKIPPRKQESPLPEILSSEELQKLFSCAGNLRNRLLLMTAYSAGLRSSEVIRLKISDIDGDRKLIHVRQAKGKKDRYSILSVRLIEELKHYWRYYRPKTWLFPSPVSGGSHIHENLAGRIFSKAREKAKIKKPCSMHTLRHSFATHLLENNVDVRTIQSFLGHSCLSTTMIYVKVTQKRTESIQSPLDNFQEESDVPTPDWVEA